MSYLGAFLLLAFVVGCVEQSLANEAQFNLKTYDSVNSILKNYGYYKDLEWEFNCIERRLGFERNAGVKQDPKVVVALKSFLELKAALKDGVICSQNTQKILKDNVARTKKFIFSSPDIRDRYANAVREAVVRRAKACQDQYALEVAKHYAIYEAESIEVEKKDKLFIEWFVDAVIPHLKAEGKFVDFHRPSSIRSTKVPIIAFKAIKRIAEELEDSRHSACFSGTVGKNMLADLLDDFIVFRAEAIADAAPASFAKAALDGSVLGRDAKLSWMGTQFESQLNAYLLKKQLISSRNYLFRTISSFMSY